MIRAGVLALQGSVIEHMNMLERLDNVEPIAVKTKDELELVQGIILPGGESTTISKLLKEFDLFGLFKRKIAQGLPVWGTCAGMILLAKEIAGEEPHFCTMDIKVRRNAYGRQIDSFGREAVIPAISDQPIQLVFIRAPWIEDTWGTVNVLSVLDGHIIAARQDNMLVTSFHPELTQNISVHEYFVSMVRERLLSPLGLSVQAAY